MTMILSSKEMAEYQLKLSVWLDDKLIANVRRGGVPECIAILEQAVHGGKRELMH